MCDKQASSKTEHLLFLLDSNPTLSETRRIIYCDFMPGLAKKITQKQATNESIGDFLIKTSFLNIRCVKMNSNR